MLCLPGAVADVVVGRWTVEQWRLLAQTAELLVVVLEPRCCQPPLRLGAALRRRRPAGFRRSFPELLY